MKIKNNHEFISKNLLAFSGIDCSGKSTQIQLLIELANNNGLEVKVFWLRPGYSNELNWMKCKIRKLFPEILPNSKNQPKRDTLFKKKKIKFLWITMALLDLIFQYGIKLRWYLLRNDIVLCDRYIHDAILDFKFKFEGFAKYEIFVKRLLLLLVPKPDCSFIITIPFSIMLDRMNIKNEPFPDSPDIRDRRYVEYFKFCEYEEMVKIDGSQSIDLVHLDIVSCITNYENL